MALLKERRFQEAHDVAEKMRKLTKNTVPWVLDRLADIEFELNDYARAESRYKRVLQEYPNEIDPHIGLARNLPPPAQDFGIA